MQEAEGCFRRCTCPVSNINHSWLVDNALKLATSMDVVEVHLHDFIWSYAVVLEQAFWLRICFIHANFDSLKQETRVLHELWAAEDTRGNLSEAREQLLKTIRCEKDKETSQLASFIVQKLTSLNIDVEPHHSALPDYLWVDAKGLRIKPDFCIGSGGFGVVHEATWLGGRFAVKDIPYHGEEAFTERERAIQARLHHPNVMSLICCTKNTALERLGLVMEFMEQDLHRMLQKRKREGKDPPCALLEAVDLMLQIAKGMEYLHSRHVIHRDLKSSNILVSIPYISSTQLSHHTHLKIADFGMAKAKQMSSYFTTKPASTLAWRALEVFQGEGMDNHAGYNKKADVYSFGLVCYEILTAELSFKEIQHLYQRVMKGERPQLPSYCPYALAKFIQRCWDGNPKNRPGFACICSLLRYFKARILLGNYKNLPSVSQKWLAHSFSTDNTIAHITDMLQSQDTSLVTALPVNILLEMYQCRLVSQESSEHCEDKGKGGNSDRTICCGQLRWKRLFKCFSKSHQVFLTGDESAQQVPLPGIDSLQISGHAMVGELV